MYIITVDYSQIFHFCTYIKMHICNLSLLFIKFLHMFFLPDVVSPCIAGVDFIQVVLSVMGC